MQPYGARYRTKQSYDQISALPLPAPMSTDDANSSSPSEIKLKHLSTAIMLAVLLQGAVRCIAVRQLHTQDMRTLSPSECACNDGVLPVTLTPLAEA